MYRSFENARQTVANAGRSEGGWESALDTIHGLLRIARRTFAAEKHTVLTHLESALSAAEEQDASGVMNHLRHAEIALP